MTRTNKNRRFKPVWGRIAIAGLWAGVIGIIFGATPGVWWTEVPMVIMLFWAMFLTAAQVTKKTRWGLIGALAIVGILILRRMQLLDFLTGGILLVILGLISLIN